MGINKVNEQRDQSCQIDHAYLSDRNSRFRGFWSITGSQKHIIMNADSSGHYQAHPESWEDVCIVCLKKERVAKSLFYELS